MERFAGAVGRVITVNGSGRLIVDFGDGAWYDVPESAVTPAEGDEAKSAYDAKANSAQPFPQRQG